MKRTSPRSGTVSASRQKHFLLGMVIAASAGLFTNTARADLTNKTATQSNIMISYAPNAGAAAQSYNLGGFSTLLADDGDYAYMNTVFNVNQGAGAVPADLFNHVSLHWYQAVVSLPYYDVAKYQGNPVIQGPNDPTLLPITDPPSGGWDYMYSGNNPTTGTVLPDYAAFVDNAPFYYTQDAENTLTDYGHGLPLVTPGKQYIMEDFPYDRVGNNGKGAEFETFLVADTTDTSGVAGALLPDQMLVLGGFEWYDDSTDIEIEQTFSGASASTLNFVNASLANGGFFNTSTGAGWQAVGSSFVVGSVPEPATLGFMSIAGLLLLKRSRRST